MRFKSTRGWDGGASFQDAILSSYAPDGGMFVPEHLPCLTTQQLRSWHPLPFPELAAKVLHLFLSEEVSAAELGAICRDAFSTFEPDDVIPLVKVGDLHVLEPIHGPTLAFKDVGLQVLARLQGLFLKRQGKKATVIVETSGDTGPAAVAAVRGLDSVNIFCMYPRGRVSPVQEKQLTTVHDQNVHIYCTGGTTDDQCAFSKSLFMDSKFVKQYAVCSMNSVNICRILVQTTYYVWAYLRSVEPEQVGVQEIAVVVPTGAFGNCSAGFWVRCMGLPIHRIVAATNANDVVHRVIQDGDFRQAGNVATISPAMDIQLAYNLERMLYYCSNQKGAVVNAIMQQVEADPMAGAQLDLLLQKRIREAFLSVTVSDAETLGTMQAVFQDEGYTLCPHSAIGYCAALRLTRQGTLPPKTKVVVIATAHPAKFEQPVMQATGAPPDFPASVVALSDLPEHAVQLEHTPSFMEEWGVRLRRDVAAAYGPSQCRPLAPRWDWLVYSVGALVAVGAVGLLRRR